MGLTTCPDCQAQVSDVAPTCPKCGRPLKDVPSGGPECYTCRRQATTKCQRCGALTCVTHLDPVMGVFMLSRMLVCDNCRHVIRFWNPVVFFVVILLVVVLINYVYYVR